MNTVPATRNLRRHLVGTPSTAFKPATRLAFILSLSLGSLGACSGGGGDHPSDGGTGGAGGTGVTTTLLSPVHVSSGAEATTADGTIDHPFATIGAANAAIVAHPAWVGDMIVHRDRTLRD
jgi:hypothetical protein